MKKMNKKGFTLIELLAVIIILGVLMIIAIPSVTSYISNSRKSAYVDTAHAIISGGRNFVNEGKVPMYDTDVTYYIDYQCVKTEGAAKSPYGEFTKAYVVVTYDGNGFDYYWTSVDEAGQGFNRIIREDLLNEDKIKSDLTDSDVVTTYGLGSTNHYVVINKNCVAEAKTPVTKQVSKKVGGPTDVSIRIVWEASGNVGYGDIARFEATLSGYEDVDYKIQWEYSADRVVWLPPEDQSWYVSGAHDTNLRVVYTPENGSYRWRINIEVL